IPLIILFYFSIFLISENQISESPQSFLTCSSSPSPYKRQYQLPLRLRGGEGRCSGRLEVYHNAVWGSVCDDQWDISDAQVVCRQLGCGAALRADGNSVFGAGEGVVWMNKVECRGNEIHLVRLVNGDNPCAGRVEVLHEGQWGTVCDFYWDMTDAAVVCRELSCGEALQAPGFSYFGRGSGKIWMDEVQCKGSESTLKDCGSKGWGKYDTSYCADHSKDAGVRCSETINYGRFTRLADGPHLCSGRLEVLYGNTWYTVCAAAFDQQDAEVVCRELDCGAPAQVLGTAAFGKGDAQMWTQEIQCGGNESLIRLCPTSNNTKCSQDNNVGLICSGKMSLFILSVTLTSGWSMVLTSVLVELNVSTSVNGAQSFTQIPLWLFTMVWCGCLERDSVRGRWKFSSIRSGGEFCWTPGVSLNPLWSADSWAVALFLNTVMSV
uniref:SRCR domain-containing protein n=1 Tax=Cyprinus carpio carpio TaxID=630221 RepID=A0A9J8A083_CYPCA